METSGIGAKYKKVKKIMESSETTAIPSGTLEMSDRNLQRILYNIQQK